MIITSTLVRTLYSFVKYKEESLVNKRFSAFFIILPMLLSLSAAGFSSFAENTSTTADDYENKLPKQVRDRIVRHTSASGADSFSWYCRHTKGGETPVCPPEMDFLTEHGGYFLGDTDEKVIYLTFDAGYENGNVAKILDTLKEKDVHGAFFVLENIVRQNPELIKKMAQDGHLVCNHTARHRDMSAVHDMEKFRTELEKLETLTRDIAGVECAKYFRPPEGRLSVSMLDFASELGYKTIMWSFAYADWDNTDQPSPDTALAKILDGAHNGMVLLLHPTSATNAAILPRLIDSLKEKGYRFGTLDELTSCSEKTSADVFSEMHTAVSPIKSDVVFTCHMNENMKIALTLDEGPHPEYTPEILDVLKKFDIPATFFVVGENASLHPELVEACRKSGHEIANHTYSHQNLKADTYENICEQIKLTERAVYENIEVRTKLLRPPCGLIDENVVKAAKTLDYSVVLWTVDTRDWAHTKPSDIAQNVIGNTKSGDIILMHDYIAKNSPSAQAIELFVPVLLEKGFRFVTVSELLGSR